MARTVSASELALEEIYRALDQNKTTMDRGVVAERSRKSHLAGLTSSPSRVMRRVEDLAPNFGVKLNG